VLSVNRQWFRLDVIEIDAASNTGVENIRDLIEHINCPSAVSLRVYVVDECHMLSVAAFNALLKTLEEPPERRICFSYNRPQAGIANNNLGANGSTFAEYPRRIGAASAEDRIY